MCFIKNIFLSESFYKKKWRFSKKVALYEQLEIQIKYENYTFLDGLEARKNNSKYVGRMAL